MARTTLSDLIHAVRSMTGAGTAVYTIGTASYWDDDQIQRVLDDNRIDIIREPLMASPTYLAGGTLSYTEYRSRHGNLERTSGGTSIFIIENSTGTDKGTSTWAADYLRGIVTFTSDQAGTAYFLTARSYDLYGAAADLLEGWAAKEAVSFDFVEDGQSFKRSQKAMALAAAAKEYRRKMRALSVTLVRDDV